MTVPPNDDLSGPLSELLVAYADKAGTSRRSAIRDVLTELQHICDRRGELFQAILADARNQYKEERRIGKTASESRQSA